MTVSLVCGRGRAARPGGGKKKFFAPRVSPGCLGVCGGKIFCLRVVGVRVGVPWPGAGVRGPVCGRGPSPGPAPGVGLCGGGRGALGAAVAAPLGGVPGGRGRAVPGVARPAGGGLGGGVAGPPCAGLKLFGRAGGAVVAPLVSRFAGGPCGVALGGVCEKPFAVWSRGMLGVSQNLRA